MKLLFSLFIFSVLSVNAYNGFTNKYDNKSFDKQSVFDRSLIQRYNRSYFEFTSKANNQIINTQNMIGFKFQKTDLGIDVNFNAIKHTSDSEYVRIVFRKLIYNNIVVAKFSDFNYNDLNCTQLDNHNTCILESRNKLFIIQVDYSQVSFNKTFANFTKKVYPTSIKLTVYINTTTFTFTENDNITLVIRMKSNNNKFFNHTKEDTVNKEVYSNGTYSYVNFEQYALDNLNHTIIVNVSTDPSDNYDDDFITEEGDHHRRDDSETNREIHFIFNVNNNTTFIIWDPTIGATDNFISQSSESSQSSNSDNLKYLGFIALGVVAIACGVIYYKRTH